MINPKELRIGNLVQIKTLDYNQPINHRLHDKIGEVVEINSEYIEFSISIRLENGWSNSFYKDYLSPIPLTDEWLLKFQFKKVKDKQGIYEKANLRVYHELEGKGLAYLINEDTRESHYLGPMQTVHQLQNLYFALTGQEL